MKNKLWFLQIPFILFFTLAFVVDELGVQGALENATLRETVFPTLRRVSGLFTDAKFKVRGPESPKNKVIIVEVDSRSIEAIGRWPWHRDATALLISQIMEAGAKVVGLDIVFSEPDQRVPDELKAILRQNKLGNIAEQFETDLFLESVIRQYADRLVLGWTSDQYCQPLYLGHDECAVAEPEVLETHPAGFEKFAYTHFESPSGFDPTRTPLMSLLYFIANLPSYNAVAHHSGYLNVWPDPDSLVRRMSLLMMAGGRPYPGLALEMARVGLGEELQLKLDDQQRVESVMFAKSGKSIPVTPVGVMEVNFRGPGRTFPYISALDVLSDDDRLQGDEFTGAFKNALKSDVFKDAYVLIGVSALGVFDMRAFPFDSNVPGVEGHANILDNLISVDSLVNTSMSNASFWIGLLMVVGAALFAYTVGRLEAIPAVLFFIGLLSAVFAVDTKILFASNRNWNTTFFYLELVSIFVFTIALKYVMEERNKKFIRGAFTKYVAPAVVDAILKDPTKLSVGGEKRDLTILFSDIRGFTTFSEKMDAKQLAGLLNDYLGIMTKIVFHHQGTLDKYIGDAIMAFWGAPLDQPNHAANACKAAMDMMKALSEHRERFRQEYGILVDIGVGLNSGIVNVGNMGSDTNFAYTVIGDHVNLASRLEGLTKAYKAGIVTSRFTFDSILESGESLPPHRVLDFVKVKGKKQAVELIQLLEKKLPAEGLKLFDEGRQLYLGQNWDDAKERFRAASEILAEDGKTDGPSEIYIERCDHFKLEPPGTGWDGSWEMLSK
ncbi:MAG: hypothetical protein A2X94_15725 [Bdellovibrionales bacterium GWB1_55_8]|nr:MAG: hypothetical protein A2X94_15725 [Bdellovibrionales bacterium GWB1_55_8]